MILAILLLTQNGLCIEERISSPASVLRSTDESFLEIRNEILNKKSRRPKRNQFHHRSDHDRTELIVNAFNDYHLISLRPIQIETDDYELKLLGDIYETEFNITDGSSIQGENCSFIGRTFGFQSDTAFINICLMQGIFTSQVDGEDIIINNPMKSSTNSTTELIAERAMSDQTTICGSKSKIKRRKPKFALLKKGRVMEAHSRHLLSQRHRHHEHRLKRKKRNNIVTRQMSVALFVDPSLTFWFRQFDRSFISIENYVKTIMGISTQILHDPSLEQDIEVKVCNNYQQSTKCA